MPVHKSAAYACDLLTMRHGLAWDEWSTSFTSTANPVKQMTQATDWWQFVLGRNMTAARDSVFRYSTGTSNLLGAVIWKLSGQSAMQYSQEHLFDELDIRDYHLEVDLADGPKGSGISSFQWWGFRIDSPRGPLQVRMAEGYADQFLLLVPELDLLVVSNADNGQYQGPDMRHWGDAELQFMSCTSAGCGLTQPLMVCRACWSCND